MANELAVKIARIMGRLDRLPKTGWNKHFSYPFVTDADVADAVRRELASENIAFFASMTGRTKEGKHTTATFEYTFICGDSGETMELMWSGEANDGQDKGLSKAATSAEKYFLLKTFMLSTGDKRDDPDSGNEDRDEQPAPHQDTPRAQPKAPAPHSAPPPAGDDFPTISSVWPDVSAGLLTMQVSDLPMPVGGLIYPSATAQLGYVSSDDVKECLQLESLKEWQGTLEGLMNRVIELADEG